MNKLLISSLKFFSLKFVSVNCCLALGKNSLFLSVQQNFNLCSNRSPRSFGHRRRRLTDRQVFSLRVMDMYSVSFAKHTLECSIIVVGVLGKPLLGEERRRGQELCVGLDVSLLEVVGVGLITCEGVGLVNGGHTLFCRSAQVLYELQGEEVEGVRQEVREVNDEECGEINVEGEPHTS